MLDIITKKKNNEALSHDELKFAFLGYLNKEIPDYQMSSLLMAIVINGMNMSEVISLTDIFIKSGDQYKLSDELDYVVDKHSTGGVGDTTTLIIGPMCASLGLKMAKMSGRGLGYTGGTIDKLESIPNFNVNVSKEKFIKQVKDIGFVLSAQTDNLVPLDKAIYSLRDVTGTTESIPLIASSIMSKKIALGAEHILIDIKYGTGALMKTLEDANKLSDVLIEIGEAYNKNVKTIISDMNVPLSQAIGNSIEVIEAMNVLKGKENNLYEACIDIVANLLKMTKNIPYEEAKTYAKNSIKSGAALKKFFEFVSAQDGDIGSISLAENVIRVKSKKDGVVTNIDALGAAKLAAKLGASKMTLDDTIDYEAGIYIKYNVGDEVKVGDNLIIIYTNKDVDFTDDDFKFISVK